MHQTNREPSTFKGPVGGRSALKISTLHVLPKANAETQVDIVNRQGCYILIQIPTYAPERTRDLFTTPDPLNSLGITEIYNPPQSPLHRRLHSFTSRFQRSVNSSFH